MGVLQQLRNPIPGAVVRVELTEAFCRCCAYPPMGVWRECGSRVSALRDRARRFVALCVPRGRPVCGRPRQLIVGACSRRAEAVLGVGAPAVVDVPLEECFVCGEGVLGGLGRARLIVPGARSSAVVGHDRAAWGRGPSTRRRWRERGCGRCSFATCDMRSPPGCHRAKALSRQCGVMW